MLQSLGPLAMATAIALSVVFGAPSALGRLQQLVGLGGPPGVAERWPVPRPGPGASGHGVRATVSAVALLLGLGPGAAVQAVPSSRVVVSVHGLGPEEPVTIATAPGGGLYVADWGRQQILERFAAGSFRVIAGTGRAGYSGDGGPAVDAEVEYPTAMVVSPTGALYFVQEVGAATPALRWVVREVAPDGKITTVVGARPDCRAHHSASGFPAEDAAFYGGTLAIGPGGRLYISTVVCPNRSNLGPLLELTPAGELVGTRWDPVLTKQVNCYGAGVAFAGDGSLYVACDSGGGHLKEVFVVHPNGRTTAYQDVYPYDDYSGLATTPGGTVVGMDYRKLVRFTARGMQTVVNLGKPGHLAPGKMMEPNGITVGPGGNIYAASSVGLGNGNFTGIVEIHPSGQVQVLWQRRAGSVPARRFDAQNSPYAS